MIPRRKILLDFPKFGVNHAGQATESICSAKWRSEAFGPTNNICRHAKATAVHIPWCTAERDVPASSNTPSAITVSGRLGQRSRNDFATAKRRTLSRNPNAQSTPSSWAMTSAKSLKTTAAKTAGTIKWTGAVGEAAMPRPAAAWPRQPLLQHPTSQVVDVVVLTAEAVATAPLDAIAPPAASLRGDWV